MNINFSTTILLCINLTAVVSVCGSKAYPLNPKYTNLLAEHSEKAQIFQVISTDGNKLQYNSFTAAGALYDSFELNKELLFTN